MRAHLASQIKTQITQLHIFPQPVVTTTTKNRQNYFDKKNYLQINLFFF